MTTSLKRHPWNTDFEWTRHHTPLRRLSAAQADAFDRDGYIVLDDAFSDVRKAYMKSRAHPPRVDQRAFTDLSAGR